MIVEQIEKGNILWKISKKLVDMRQKKKLN